VRHDRGAIGGGENCVMILLRIDEPGRKQGPDLFPLRNTDGKIPWRGNHQLLAMGNPLRRLCSRSRSRQGPSIVSGVRRAMFSTTPLLRVSSWTVFLHLRIDWNKCWIQWCGDATSWRASASEGEE